MNDIENRITRLKENILDKIEENGEVSYFKEDVMCLIKAYEQLEEEIKELKKRRKSSIQRLFKMCM